MILVVKRNRVVTSRVDGYLLCFRWLAPWRYLRCCVIVVRRNSLVLVLHSLSMLVEYCFRAAAVNTFPSASQPSAVVHGGTRSLALYESYTPKVFRSLSFTYIWIYQAFSFIIAFWLQFECFSSLEQWKNMQFSYLCNESRLTCCKYVC